MTLTEVLALSTGQATPQKKLFGGHFFTFPQTSQIAAYIYFSVLTLALNIREPRQLLPLVWSQDEESLWLAFRQTYSGRLARVGGKIDPDLRAQMFYVETQFPEAFGGIGEGESVASWSRRAERAAKQTYPFEEALQLWGSAAAEALALVLFDPTTARTLIDAQFAPSDPESWKRLHDAGLDIPEEPDIVDEMEHAMLMREILSAFLRQEHPEMLHVLD